MKDPVRIGGSACLIGNRVRYDGGYKLDRFLVDTLDIPLIVPVTLINHFVRKYEQPYLSDQVYLDPHPIALQLRNHV